MTYIHRIFCAWTRVSPTVVLTQKFSGKVVKCMILIIQSTCTRLPVLSKRQFTQGTGLRYDISFGTTTNTVRDPDVLSLKPSS